MGHHFNITWFLSDEENTRENDTEPKTEDTPKGFYLRVVAAINSKTGRSLR